MDEKVVVAAVQMEPKFAAPEENLAAILNWAEEASKCGAQLVVFPECALTGYCFESREEAMAVAEPIDGKICERNLAVVQLPPLLACRRDFGTSLGEVIQCCFADWS
jgi:predicted amidohydrolase